jgi:hypothetical protein
MAEGVTSRRTCSETQAHKQLKRLALLWAQSRGFTACAAEVSLPRCRYRADVAAYRPDGKNVGITAVFECKQAFTDLRRDNCFTAAARARLESLSRRRQVLQKHLRVHYPTLRTGDSLFPEFDSHDFDATKHHGYARVAREMTALHNRLHGGAKFERLVRYRCANVFFIVLPNQLFRQSELPVHWGALVEENGCLKTAREATLFDNSADCRLRLLERIAAAGTRRLNQAMGLTFEDVLVARPAC